MKMKEWEQMGGVATNRKVEKYLNTPSVIAQKRGQKEWYHKGKKEKYKSNEKAISGERVKVKKKIKIVKRGINIQRTLRSALKTNRDH